MKLVFTRQKGNLGTTYVITVAKPPIGKNVRYSGHSWMYFTDTFLSLIEVKAIGKLKKFAWVWKGS